MRPQKLLAREDDEREHTKLLLKGFESDGESSLNLACALVKDHIMKNKKARSICTYGRARTCVIIVGTASLIYNIPRFLEVTWTTQEVCGINRTIPFATDLRMNLTYVKYVRN